MPDPHDRIDALESQIGELRDQLETLNQDLVDAQLDAWRSRVEELELQARLASMDARDEVSSLIDQLRACLTEAREQLKGVTGSSSEAMASLRTGLDQAADDVRTALRNAVNTLKK